MSDYRKCVVCDYNVEGSSSCKRCGFPVLSAGSQEELEHIRQMAEEYKELHFLNVRLAVVANRNAEDPDNPGYVKTVSQDHLPIARFLEVMQAGTVWNDTSFCRPDGEDCTLELVLESGGKETVTQVSMKSPKLKSLVNVGLQYDSPTTVKVLVGVRNNYTESAAISISR